MSTELSITQVVSNNLLNAINSLLQRSDLGYQSELNKLQLTVSAINTVLVDALRNEQYLSPESRRLIEKIKEVVYEADDLVDQLQAVISMRKYAKPSSKVKFMFFNTSGMIKGVRKQCKGFTDVSIPAPAAAAADTSSIKTEDTSSYLYAPNVIGRDPDVDTVLDLLIYGDHGFVSIVGLVGLGKTTVAQLVFNHQRAITTFPSRVWVCVAGCDTFKAICAKILQIGFPLENTLNDDGSCVHKLCQLLQMNRFLVVLDDVWCENGDELKKLRQLLEKGMTGSRILATTRVRTIASKIGGEARAHELKGLSEEDSWKLFELTAFDAGLEKDSLLVEIGRSIAANCANVPLALKVLGSDLHGRHRHKWLASQVSMRKNILYDSPTLMSILKRSYYQLDTPLKCCFSFCALFPKDLQIPKDLLVSLWIAQGYIQESSNQCIDDVADNYFTALLERSFLQSVEINEYGAVVSCRIHDLMHALAQQLAGEGLGVVQSWAKISERARHVFHDGKHDKEVSFAKTRIRTYLQSGFCGPFPVATLLANCKSLRALGLHDLDDRVLPDSISTLIHLRYLDLSCNNGLEALPKSVTELCYLETLDLRGCSKLKELPGDLSKLRFLRCLDILGCELLTRMPSNMNSLTRLRTLTSFVMDEGDSSGKLEDLKALLGLKGCIEILIPAKYTAAGKFQGECLRGMPHFKAVSLHFQENSNLERDSVLLEKLQPHENLQGLTLKGYQGAAVHWSASIQNLVKLELISCVSLTNISFLSKLEFLKSLVLHNLVKLEYMEDASSSSSNSSSSSSSGSSPVFFPLLEYLNISGMCNLQRWWQKIDLLPDGELVDNLKSTKETVFPCLSELHIQSCLKLVAFPPCPKVNKLYLTDSNKTVSLRDLCWATELEIDDIGYLKSVAKSKLRKLKVIGGCYSEEDDEPWRLIHKSVESLELDSLENMVNLPKGMQHLSGLQHLSISHCNNLKVIPEWIDCLVSLESLRIISCTGLKLLPESMRKLTSLRHFEVQGHTYLQKRCQAVHGEDWPKIQHIASVIVQD